ncbi:unnamed protein product [Orchesella dallaii]|uniref:Uncharacterized protein n=1 Tax=Orchesella dallaii TaxID=48710 RepID=A0ABP1PIB2_9HEXA
MGTRKQIAKKKASELANEYLNQMNQFLAAEINHSQFENKHQDLESNALYSFAKLKLRISDKDKDTIATDLLSTLRMFKEAFLTSGNVKTVPLPVEMGNQVCGKITYSKSDPYVLGKGSNGTKVYKGTWEGRQVAIKRLDCEQTDVVKTRMNEINALIKCDAHKNVVRYFGEEELQGEFILLALELCDFTLEKWVDCKGMGDNNAKISRLNILQQATEGLNYLHSQNIIHRDIKPQNILLRMNEKNKEIIVKISDFGICKILPEGRSHQTMTGGSGGGSGGWMAPEILKFQEERGRSGIREELKTEADIFSLGCVYYYVLTWGYHPYGSPVRRNGNILDNNVSFEKLEGEHIGLNWLLKSMTSIKKSSRPPASAILQHHIFWSKERCVTFLVHIKNRAKDTESSVNSEKLKKCKTSLEMRSKLFHGSFPTWFSHLCPVLSRYLKTKTKYGKCETQSSVMDLILLIRNMHAHISDDPPEVKEAVGVSPSVFFDYWITRFPYIITVTWLAFQTLKKLPEYGLKDYYPEDFDFQFKSFKN